MASTKNTNLCRLPAELLPEQIVAVADTREQLPLDLTPLRTVTNTLTTGDYSVQGLEHVVAIERKSLPDLLSCVGQHRERFDRELQRLLAYPIRALVVEASWADLERGEWPSRVTPQAALGSVRGWMAMGLPVVMAGDHDRAGRHVVGLLTIAARRRWRELRALVKGIRQDCEPIERGWHVERGVGECIWLRQGDALRGGEDR